MGIPEQDESVQLLGARLQQFLEQAVRPLEVEHAGLLDFSSRIV